MKSLWKLFFIGVVVIFCFSGEAAAEEWTILGPRALGMGGAGVAVVNDATASHWNPAALAKRPGFAVDIAAGINLSAEGGIIKEADELYDTVSGEGPNGYTLEEAIDELDKKDGYADEAAEVKAKSDALSDILAALKEVPDLNKDAQGILGEAYGGMLIRYNNFGFSATGVGYAAADPYVNLGDASGWNLVEGEADVEAQFETMYGTDLDNLGINTPSTTGGTQLADDLGVLLAEGTSLTQTEANNAANELVYTAEQAGVDLNDPTIQTIIKNVAEGTALATTDGDVFADNAGVEIKSLQIQEFRVSYARSFLSESLSVGVNIKALEGKTLYYKYSMRDLKEGEDIVDEITEEKNANTTTRYDADIGILYTPFEKLSVGLMAKHLASPEFDFISEAGTDAVKLEPMVRLGVGLRPLHSLTLAADADLTVNESEILEEYKSRQIGIGAEWKPFGILALRGGGYNNIESDETGWIYTAGLGLRLFKLSLDISGAMAADKQEIGSGEDKEEISSRYSLAALLAFSTTF
ncbi:MAG: hypothetical protein E3J94_07775 [Desulfobacteraceae bacterium]|nr:MAG: hypothetical protein E3J94_07775 [Desulfobacteraceae bacterium]